jgi:hypothetical protein
VAKFVPGEQAKLCGDTFRLPVLTPSGEKQMRPIELSQAQIKQVFGDGRIRTIAEQKPFMLAAPPARRQTVQDVPATLTGDALFLASLAFQRDRKRT